MDSVEETMENLFTRWQDEKNMKILKIISR